MTREWTVVLPPDVVLHECLRTVLPFTVVTTVEQLPAVAVADELPRAGTALLPWAMRDTPPSAVMALSRRGKMATLGSALGGQSWLARNGSPRPDATAALSSVTITRATKRGEWLPE